MDPHIDITTAPITNKNNNDDDIDNVDDEGKTATPTEATLHQQTIEFTTRRSSAATRSRVRAHRVLKGSYQAMVHLFR